MVFEADFGEDPLYSFQLCIYTVGFLFMAVPLLPLNDALPAGVREVMSRGGASVFAVHQKTLSDDGVPQLSFGDLCQTSAFDVFTKSMFLATVRFRPLLLTEAGGTAARLFCCIPIPQLLIYIVVGKVNS